jgi:hypothetical protein
VIREWVKVLIGSLALLIGASFPTLTVEYLKSQRETRASRVQSNLQQPRSGEPSTQQVPLEPTPQEKKEEEKARQDRRLADYTEALFFATLFLGFVTGGLAIVAFWQMRDARRAISAAEASAKASEQQAKTAERELVELERAYVMAGIGGSGIGREGEREVVILSASALNYGKTPGFVDRIYYHIGPLGPVDPEQLPITPDGYERHVFVGWVIGPLTKRDEELTVPFGSSVLPLEGPLIFHGLITYTDIFGNHHYCGFAHRINTNGTTQPILELDAYVRHD